MSVVIYVGFPGGSVVKNLPANAGDLGLIPGQGRFLGEGHGRPLQCSCLGSLVDRGAWWSTVHRIVKIRTRLRIHAATNRKLQHFIVYIFYLGTGFEPHPQFSFFFLICGGFCHTLKWNSHGFACVPHPDPPSPHPQFDGCSNLQVPRARTHPWWRSRFRLVRGPGGFHMQRGMSGSDSVKLLCWIFHSAWYTLPTRTEEACFTLIWMTCKYYAFHYRPSKNFSVLCIGVSYTTLVFI